MLALRACGAARHPRRAFHLLLRELPALRGNVSSFLLLALGIAGVSTAALWMRVAGVSSQDQQTLAGELVFRRLALSVPLLAVWAACARARLLPRRDEWTRVLVSGGFLAAHFHLWGLSLAYLPTAVATLLVNLHPVLVLVVELSRRRFSTRLLGVMGVFLAIVGTAMVSETGDLEKHPRHLLGILIGLGSAAGLAGYLLAGRSLRETLPASSYSLAVYGVAALVLAVYQVALGGGALLPGTPREWQLAVLLAVFPTLLGHTAMNAALSRLSATVVSTAFLGEVVGATLLVWLVVGEPVPARFLPGGLLIALGIVAVSAGGRGSGTDSRPGKGSPRSRPPPHPPPAP